MSSLPSLWSLCGGYVLTYLIHSTCLLSICWVATLIVNRQFHAFHSQAWKTASLLGIATASIALTSNSANELRLGWSLVGERRELPSTASSLDAQVEIVLNTSSDDSISSSAIPLQAGILADDTAKDVVTMSMVIPQTDSEIEVTPVNEESSIKSETEVTLQAGKSQPLPLSTFAGIALALCLLRMIRFSFQWHSYRRLMNSCQPCSRRATRILRRLQKDCERGANVQVLLNPRASQPFATGLVHWTIVLPPGLEDQLDDDELYALLAHEFGHLQRRDIVWQWIGEFMCICLAIQPLNFVARRKWQSTSEFLADRWSCEQGGASPMALAKCLTLVAERTSETRNKTHLSSAFSQKTGNQLVCRVDQLLRLSPAAAAPRSSRWAVRIAAGATSAAICSLAVFAPHCLPNSAMGAEVVASPFAVRDARQWSEAELELQSLQSELLQLVDLLQAQQRSPEVDQIVQGLQLRISAITERANSISRKIHYQENQ